MDAFLITYNGTTSEWLENFEAVQNEMNRLEKVGIVSNVTVQKFEAHKLVKAITYNWNGENWEAKK